MLMLLMVLGGKSFGNYPLVLLPFELLQQLFRPPLSRLCAYPGKGLSNRLFLSVALLGLKTTTIGIFRAI
jgi:hypothetical protein